MLGKTLGSVECPSGFKTLNISNSMVHDVTKNCPSISVSLSTFQIFKFIDFGAWALL